MLVTRTPPSATKRRDSRPPPLRSTVNFICHPLDQLCSQRQHFFLWVLYLPNRPIDDTITHQSHQNHQIIEFFTVKDQIIAALPDGPKQSQNANQNKFLSHFGKVLIHLPKQSFKSRGIEFKSKATAINSKSILQQRKRKRSGQYFHLAHRKHNFSLLSIPFSVDCLCLIALLINQPQKGFDFSM